MRDDWRMGLPRWVIAGAVLLVVLVIVARGLLAHRCAERGGQLLYGGECVQKPTIIPMNP